MFIFNIEPEHMMLTNMSSNFGNRKRLKHSNFDGLSDYLSRHSIGPCPLKARNEMSFNCSCVCFKCRLH